MLKEIENPKIINEFLKYFNFEYTDNPFRKYLVLDDKGILVYSLIYDRLEIDYLYVKEEYRKSGIASKLLDYLFKKYNLACSLEVNVNNEAAISLYKKYAFKIASVRQNYYGNEDGYLMVREVK